MYDASSLCVLSSYGFFFVFVFVVVFFVAFLVRVSCQENCVRQAKLQYSSVLYALLLLLLLCCLALMHFVCFWWHAHTHTHPQWQMQVDAHSFIETNGWCQSFVWIFLFAFECCHPGCPSLRPTTPTLIMLMQMSEGSWDLLLLHNAQLKCTQKCEPKWQSDSCSDSCSNSDFDTCIRKPGHLINFLLNYICHCQLAVRQQNCAIRSLLTL